MPDAILYCDRCGHIIKPSSKASTSNVRVWFDDAEVRQVD